MSARLAGSLLRGPFLCGRTLLRGSRLAFRGASGTSLDQVLGKFGARLRRQSTPLLGRCLLCGLLLDRLPATVRGRGPTNGAGNLSDLDIAAMALRDRNRGLVRIFGLDDL